MYEFLASFTLIIHLFFILFVVFGGLLFFIEKWIITFHIPSFLYGVYVEFTQSICPLTYLENLFLSKAKIETYSTSFIQNYLIPIIYPIDLTKELQTTSGVLLIIINVVIYVIIFKKFKK